MEYSGFFDAILDKNGKPDRLYKAEDWDRHLENLISNGVFAGGTNLQVTADGSAMSVVLQPGPAWINGKNYLNDQALAFAIDAADGTLSRIDRIVICLDYGARSITAQIKKGAFASTAAAPTLQRDADKYELCLANISVPAGTTAITQSLITDTRLDNDVCGIVHAVVDHIKTGTFYNQIADDLARFRSTNEAGFTTWVNGLKEVLDENTAGNLLNLINTHKSDQTVHVTTLACTKSGTVYALTGMTATEGKVPVMFIPTTHYVAGDTVTIDGTAYTLHTRNGSALTTGAWDGNSIVIGVVNVNIKVLYVGPSRLPNPGALDIRYGYVPELPTYYGTARTVLHLPFITFHTSEPGSVVDGEIWAVYE